MSNNEQTIERQILVEIVIENLRKIQLHDLY